MTWYLVPIPAEEDLCVDYVLSPAADVLSHNSVRSGTRFRRIMTMAFALASLVTALRTFVR